MRLVRLYHGARLAIAAIILAGLVALFGYLIYLAYRFLVTDHTAKPPPIPPSPSPTLTNNGGGGGVHSNNLLPHNPYEIVRSVYQRIAENAPDIACGRFTDQAAEQFAANFGASSCPEAVAKLSAEVSTAPGSKNAYAEPDFHGKMQNFDPQATTIQISSCELGVTAGPRLGRFTLSQIEFGQWIITGHHLEAC